MENTLTTILALLTGGGIWEGFKFIYPDLKRPIERRNSARKTFYKNLDPILKSASELYGKLESLSKEDFATFINVHNSNSTNPEHNKKYIYYLFSQFWAQLEFLRLESQYVDIGSIDEGRDLISFIDTFESRKFRVLDRSIQRIIGECLISTEGQKFRVLTLKEFLIHLDDPNSVLTMWIKELEMVLDNTKDNTIRQKVLIFGVIIAALIDRYDPDNKMVRKRKIYLNKLSKKSKKEIRFQLTRHYLPFLKKKEIYFGKY